MLKGRVHKNLGKNKLLNEPLPMCQPPASIIHLSGKECVTDSCHLLQGAGLQIMIDYGTAQGNDSLLPMTDWSIKLYEIDYLFLTHAHIDHIGRFAGTH